MVNKIFQYDNINNRVDINMEEILLIREFSKLFDEKRNISKNDPKGKNKLRAFKEITYIWLALDWQSIYSDYLERERHEEALKDSGLTTEELNDKDFKAACRKYIELQESNRSIKMLNAARNTIDKFINYFNNINPEERDESTGKPIFKVKDIMSEISNLSKINEELKNLESQVKKEIQEQSSLRGGAVEGFIPKGF